jgi:hypothetical protein
VQKEWTADARLRCVCGHSILCKVHGAGKGIGLLAFFDVAALAVAVLGKGARELRVLNRRR